MTTAECKRIGRKLHRIFKKMKMMSMRTGENNCTCGVQLQTSICYRINPEMVPSNTIPGFMLCVLQRGTSKHSSLVHPWSEHTSLTPGVHALTSSLGSVSLYYTFFLVVCSVTFCLNIAKTQNRDRLNSTHFNVIGIGTDAEIQFSDGGPLSRTTI